MVHINKETVRHMWACQQFFDKRANARTSTWLRYGTEDLCSFMRKQEKEIIITDQRNYYEIHSCLKDKEVPTGFVVFQ